MLTEQVLRRPYKPGYIISAPLEPLSSPGPLTAGLFGFAVSTPPHNCPPLNQETPGQLPSCGIIPTQAVPFLPQPHARWDKTVAFVTSHLKCPVVFVVLDHFHEVASQCFQELSRVHLSLDLQFGTQAEEEEKQKLVLNRLPRF